MEKSTLDKVLKEKVEPILDESLHKVLGITISEFGKDITDKIEKSPLIGYDIDTSLSFKVAKKMFKKQFLTRLLQSHQGNITEVAEISGMDRRSIHRAIKNLRIGIKCIRREILRSEHYQKEAIGGILKSTLDDYKKIIRPAKLDQMYANVDELSSEILHELPVIEMRWDEAEKLFEKEYLKQVIEENKGNVSKTARNIGLRYETLHRKLKRLGLR